MEKFDFKFETPDFKEFKTIEDVWRAVEAGKTVYWSNKAYKIYVEKDLMPERTLEYPPRKLIEKNGYLLCVRCISNHFGSILHLKEIPALFTEPERK